MRESVFELEFRSDLQYWAKNDREILLKIFELIEATIRDPFKGIGKLERLCHKSFGDDVVTMADPVGRPLCAIRSRA